jgi:hypothetical protein
MKNRLLYALACSMTLLTGCHNNEQDSETLSSISSHKPSVAIVPMIDRSQHQLGWNLSEEITCTLCSKLDQKNIFQMALPAKIKSQSKRVKELKNPFDEDISWVKKTFSEEEFVVFIEMIDHSEVPHKTEAQTAPEMLPADLNICVRLHIIDNRAETPVITLSEIIQDSHFVPRQFTQYNFYQAPWTAEEFSLSPVGIAHAQLIKELKTRIEDYILLAQARR